MRIIFIRHGETYSNRENRLSGHTDVKLTENGVLQAIRSREKLTEYKISKVYCSDLTRAKVTAEIVTEGMDIEIQQFEGFRERNFGIWENMTISEVAKKAPDWFVAPAHEWGKYPIENGESGREFFDRVVECFEGILSTLDKDSDENIVIVAHAGVIMSLLSYLLYGDETGYWRFDIQNATLNIIEFVSSYVVVKAINL